MSFAPVSGSPAAPEGVNMPPTQGFWQDFRNRIVEGLLVALPLAVTIWVFHYIYRTLELYVIDPLAFLVLWKARNLKRISDLPDWFEFYAAPLIAIVIAVALLYFLGSIARTRFRRGMDNFLSRVPLVSLVYDAVRNVMKSLEKPAAGPQKPQRMVLVPFPHPGMQLPAIVTSSCRDVETGKTILCVYVPTTPVPASGFFLMIPEDEVSELNWEVPAALQTIISGGLSAPPDVTYFSPKKAAAIKHAVANDGGSIASATSPN